MDEVTTRGRGERGRRGPLARAANKIAPMPQHKLLLTIGNGGGVRYEILFALAARPRSVGALVRDIELDQPRISQHLRLLWMAGLVVDACEGGKTIYRVGGNAEVLDTAVAGVPAILVTGSDGFSNILMDTRRPKAPPGAAVEDATALPASWRPTNTAVVPAIHPALQVQSVLTNRSRKKPPA